MRTQHVFVAVAGLQRFEDGVYRGHGGGDERLARGPVVHDLSRHRTLRVQSVRGSKANRHPTPPESPRADCATRGTTPRDAARLQRENPINKKTPC